MPLHRFKHVDATDGVAALEAEGHVVTSVSTDDAGVYVTTTEPKAKRVKPGEGETR